MFYEAQLDERYPLLSKLSEPLKKAERDIVGREHETMQLLASMSRPELCNALLLAEAGTGKLLPLDTPVPTPTGWSTMGDLQPGDLVLGRDGKPTRVSYISNVEQAPVLYDLRFSDGQTITACADHQWLVTSVADRAAAYDTNVATTQARRDRVEARRAALLAVLETEVPEYATAAELIELISGIEGVTWLKPSRLHTYLMRQGVEYRKVPRTGEQARKGGVRTATVHVHEFNTEIAIKALSEQVFRRTSWGTSGVVGEAVQTTQQMVDAGVRLASSGRSRFSIRLTRALDLPQVDLPVDPYVLGAWLGDGSRGSGRLTQSDAVSVPDEVSDMQHLIRQISAAGFEASKAGYSDNTIDTRGLKTVLREVGVLEAKHIPMTYLRSSIEQRLALLQGLMDTDGTIDARGTCALALSDERLATDALELIRSLGIKVNRLVSAAGYTNLKGEWIEGQPRHRMVFTTDQQVFRLPRKVERISDSVRSTQDYLYVVDITPAEARPGRCIQVDNDEHMYLVGAGLVPTHNTALVQATMLVDPDRLYLEVDPARMISEAGNAENMAAKLKGFFDEAEDFVKDQKRELVLFIDEFHQIIQLSDAAAEAIKPVLAASGTRGIRIIAATTYEEFHKHISPNQPLVERLQRINLNPPDQATTIKILQGMAERYGVADEFYDDHIFRQIYEYTQRYMPASAQPRKSILVLDSMVGWHQLTHRPMDRDLLSDVLMESLNVNVAFRVDGAKIKQQLDAKVFSQDWATGAVARRLQLSVADLNDKGKPMASMLFTGSTGTGKFCIDSTQVPVYSSDGETTWKLHGDLVPGDRVFGRQGRPVEVLGHFPQGMQDVYRVTLWDGRTLDVGGPHLWAVYTAKQRSKRHAGKDVAPMVLSTQEMVERGVVRTYPGVSREHLKFFIPANGPVHWPEQDLDVDPYVLGVLIGNGCLTEAQLTLSSDGDDADHTAWTVGEWLGSAPKSYGHNYSWVFPVGVGPVEDRRDSLYQTKDVLASVPDLIGARSAELRIPERYKHGSVQQRWALVRGLFDTDGSIGGSNDRFNVSYSTSSKRLTEDLREVLFSLGVSNTIKSWIRTKEGGRELVEYDVHVKVGNEDKARFFSLPRKHEIARRAVIETSGRKRVKKFDMVGIASIEKLPEQQSSSCIYVNDEEHLYQAGQFVVTHNTELTKQLARLLFGDDQRHLIRFDMTEYAEDSSFAAFRSELTKRVWDLSHAVLLFDEVEKASAMVTRVLLQVLDDGRLNDDNNREVSFLNTYIVLTTNAGSEIYKNIAQYAADDTGSGKQLLEYEKLIRRSISSTTGDNRFPPELLGRIDAIVPFQPLSLPTQQKIVRKKLRQMVQEVFVKHNVRVDVDARVLQYLIEDKGDTDSDAGGARAAVAKLTDEVTTAVATFLNEHPSERRIRIDVVGDLVSDDKNLLSSDAYVEVSAVR
ncbi:AAA family ATPase [Streptomyces sp. NPDC093149]|uniref:AAA family ATPase n=1 Tax=Streptomyces sp. NPDC093149 TaxID=3366031 RepID=UPI0038109FAB